MDTKWIENVTKIHREYSFQNSRSVSFHYRDQSGWIKLFLGYGIFGLPNTDASCVQQIFESYSDKQKTCITSIYDNMGKLNPQSEYIYLRKTFILYTKEDNDSKNDLELNTEIIFPFSFFEADHILFADVYARIYKNWDDFVENNELPPCLYCVPKNGYYSTELLLDFRTSPSSTIWQKILNASDFGFGALGIGAITASFISSAPVVVPLALCTGITATSYSVIRSMFQLNDRISHEQSIGLENSESRMCYLNIAAGCVSGATAGAVLKSASLARFGANGATVVKVLTGTALLVDGIAFANSVHNLYSKDEITYLDVLDITVQAVFLIGTIVNTRRLYTELNNPSSRSKKLSKTQKRNLQRKRAKARLRGEQIHSSIKFTNDTAPLNEANCFQLMKTAPDIAFLIFGHTFNKAELIYKEFCTLRNAFDEYIKEQRPFSNFIHFCYVHMRNLQREIMETMKDINDLLVKLKTFLLNNVNDLYIKLKPLFKSQKDIHYTTILLDNAVLSIENHEANIRDSEVLATSTSNISENIQNDISNNENNINRNIQSDVVKNENHMLACIKRIFAQIINGNQFQRLTSYDTMIKFHREVILLFTNDVICHIKEIQSKQEELFECNKLFGEEFAERMREKNNEHNAFKTSLEQVSLKYDCVKLGQIFENLISTTDSVLNLNVSDILGKLNGLSDTILEIFDSLSQSSPPFFYYKADIKLINEITQFVGDMLIDEMSTTKQKYNNEFTGNENLFNEVMIFKCDQIFNKTISDIMDLKVNFEKSSNVRNIYDSYYNLVNNDTEFNKVIPNLENVSKVLTNNADITNSTNINDALSNFEEKSELSSYNKTDKHRKFLIIVISLWSKLLKSERSNLNKEYLLRMFNLLIMFVKGEFVEKITELQDVVIISGIDSENDSILFNKAFDALDRKCKRNSNRMLDQFAAFCQANTIEIQDFQMWNDNTNLNDAEMYYHFEQNIQNDSEIGACLKQLFNIDSSFCDIKRDENNVICVTPSSVYNHFLFILLHPGDEYGLFAVCVRKENEFDV